AVDIDPSFGIGWLVLSNAYYHGALRVPAMAEEWLRRAPAARAQARALVPDDPWLSMLGARENVAAGNWFAAGAFFEGEMQQLIDETLGGNTPPSTYWLQGEYFLWAGRTSE